MSTPSPNWAPPPPTPMNQRVRGFLGCAGAGVGGVLILAVIGAILGPQKSTTSSSPAAHVTSASARASSEPASSLKATSTPTHSQAPKASPKPRPAGVPEGLTFTGPITGHLTLGLDPKGALHVASDPLPGWGMFLQTSCTDYVLDGQFAGTHEWEADIYGKLNGQNITIRFGLEGDAKIPGTHPLSADTFDPTAVQAFIDTPSNQELHYPVFNTTITINSDEHSGSIHMGISDIPRSSDAKEQVTGTWRCA